MRKAHAFTAAFLSLALAGHAQQAFGPPACPAPAGSPDTTRPSHANPSLQSIEDTARANAADPHVLTASEPPNFGVARYRLAEYYDCTGNSGCYWADIDAQTRRAETELDRLLAEHHATTPDTARAQKLAIVLDIDETSLSSYCEEKREDFGYIPSMFETWIVSPEASIPIPGTLRLFNHARDAGVAVFFITGRPGKGMPNDQDAPTARNLETAGYRGWAGLLLRDASYNAPNTIAFKSAARASIEKQGYRILLNIGDQWSDLDGAPQAEMSVKFPDPIYYLP